ncbi:PHD and RING finger domain-containing protein isoform X1 [Spatholobus suberectus]|nr:PHD and RING finger domain-containing protein isoform X1 [Spatholobus suberectus]
MELKPSSRKGPYSSFANLESHICPIGDNKSVTGSCAKQGENKKKQKSQNRIKILCAWIEARVAIHAKLESSEVKVQRVRALPTLVWEKGERNEIRIEGLPPRPFPSPQPFLRQRHQIGLVANGVLTHLASLLLAVPPSTAASSPPPSSPASPSSTSTRPPSERSRAPFTPPCPLSATTKPIIFSSRLPVLSHRNANQTETSAVLQKLRRIRARGKKINNLAVKTIKTFSFPLEAVTVTLLHFPSSNSIIYILKNRRVFVRNWQGRFVVDICKFYLKDAKWMHKVWWPLILFRAQITEENESIAGRFDYLTEKDSWKMGGCYCSAKKPHLHGTPVYYYPFFSTLTFLLQQPLSLSNPPLRFLYYSLNARLPAPRCASAPLPLLFASGPPLKPTSGGVSSVSKVLDLLPMLLPRNLVVTDLTSRRSDKALEGTDEGISMKDGEECAAYLSPEEEKKGVPNAGKLALGDNSLSLGAHLLKKNFSVALFCHPVTNVWRPATSLMM